MAIIKTLGGSGVAVREFPTSTGPVDYALFVDSQPCGVIEAKKDDAAEHITTVEQQSSRYANSTFKWVKQDYQIRFAYEATGEITRFTDYKDIKYRSRTVFSFHRPETLRMWLHASDTVRNNMKHFPSLDTTGFRSCQITAMLPRMKTDITLSTRNGQNVLIIDAKYYASTTQMQFGVNTLHSGNLYQIFTYVKNRQAGMPEGSHPVSGMLLYAKTDEEITPNQEYQMSGNKITVRTLDLNQPFQAIAAELDGIANKLKDNNH